MKTPTRVPPAGPADAPPLPRSRIDGAGPVVWRSWRVVPDRRGNFTTPLLTGLFGFPWRETRIDAKCTEQDRALDGIGLLRRIDRHHRVIPDPGCTCGIYAGKDELTAPRIAIPLRGRPLVTGFVELGGRIIEGRDVYRAQQASIVGPLTIWIGRPPLTAVTAARFGMTIQPRRVITEGDRYRIQWTKGRAGTPAAEWLLQTAGALTRRYAVQVLTPLAG